MENLICITLIIGVSICVLILIWKLTDLCKLKSELKHKETMEDKRINAKKELEKLKFNEDVKSELTKEFKNEINKLVKETIDKTLTERIKILEDKLDSINFESKKN